MLNLMQFIGRGVALSGLLHRQDAHRAAKVEEARSKWISAMQVDELRTWLDVGQRAPETLRGLHVSLTLAALVAVHDEGRDAPAVRVIRGALRALEDCALKRGAAISVVDARALSVGVEHAKSVLMGASHRALVEAAQRMQELVQQEEGGA